MSLRICRSALTILALAGGLSVASPLAHAGPLVDPFGRSAYDLSDADWDLLKGSVRTVLQKQVVGATSDWTSASSGKAGRATLIKTFSRSGMICGDVRHDFTKGEGRSYQLPFCQMPDGSWKIAF